MCNIQDTNTTGLLSNPALQGSPSVAPTPRAPQERQQQQEHMHLTATVDGVRFAGASTRQDDTTTCVTPACFADVALPIVVASTPRSNECLFAQPCPSDANSATAADVTEAVKAGDAASTTTGQMQLAESSYADDDAAKGSTNQEETQSEEHELQSHLSDKTSCATCHEPLLHDVSDNMSNPSSRREVSQTTRTTKANKDETDLATQLMNHKAMESACNDEEPTAQEVKQDATTNSAFEELLLSGLSWPTVVAAAGESSPVAVATNCASPPQPHDSINDNTYATVLPRSLSCSLAADYFDMLQTPPPTPRKDLPGGRENT